MDPRWRRAARGACGAQPRRIPHVSSAATEGLRVGTRKRGLQLLLLSAAHLAAQLPYTHARRGLAALRALHQRAVVMRDIHRPGLRRMVGGCIDPPWLGREYRATDGVGG